MYFRASRENTETSGAGEAMCTSVERVYSSTQARRIIVPNWQKTNRPEEGG